MKYSKSKKYALKRAKGGVKRWKRKTKEVRKRKRYYLQITQPSGKRSNWRGGYSSKRTAQRVAKSFRGKGWKVRVTTKKTKYN